MRKIFFLYILFALMLTAPAPPASALVKLTGESGAMIKDIPLIESAQMTEGGVKLKRVTQGLRQKKVVLAWFSVYVAQFFSAAPVDLKSIATLKSSFLKSLPLVVMMTFVRDVEAEKIKDGFRDIFKENQVNVDSPPVKGFLEAVQKAGDVKDRQVYTFVFSEDKGKESFRFQTAGKEVYALQDQAPGTLAQFMNMWLGKPVDSGLEQLQEQLLKP